MKTVHQAPDYPMQMMVAVFDFPEKAASAPDGHVPLIAVDFVRGGPSRHEEAIRRPMSAGARQIALSEVIGGAVVRARPHRGRAARATRCARA